MDLREHQLVVSPKVNRHPWEQARLKILKFLIKPYTKNTILDIGSGDAFIASELASANPHATIVGVDIHYTDEILGTLSATRPQNLYLQKDLQKVKTIFGNKIDLVVMMDVLEHVPNPSDLLNLIAKDNVSEHAVYIITVPALQSLFSEHDRRLGHFKRYNLKSLKILLEQNRLQAISAGYAFNSLAVIRRLQLLIEKKAGRHTYEDTGIHNWKAGRFISTLITSFFWIEFKFSWYLSKIGVYIPGLTCYCICRRLP